MRPGYGVAMPGGDARRAWLSGEPAWCPDDDEGTRCYFCGDRPAVMAYRLNETKLVAPGVGGFSLGGRLLTCARCGKLFDEYRDDDLDAFKFGDHFRGKLRALHAAAVAKLTLTRHVDPPEIVALRQVGFAPLDGFTGITEELGPLWPGEHSRAFADTGSWAGSGDLRWYVRSPWPTVRITEIFSFLWIQVEQDDRSRDPAIRADRVRDVVSWPESRAREVADAVGSSPVTADEDVTP